MPRIYKPVRPSANKAVTPVTETKNPEGKPPEVPKPNDKDKKEGGQ